MHYIVGYVYISKNFRYLLFQNYFLYELFQNYYTANLQYRFNLLSVLSCSNI